MENRSPVFLPRPAGWAPPRLLRVAILVTAAALSPVPDAGASVVRRATLDEVLLRCSLVFRGTVLESWSEASPGGVHTWVRFRVEKRLAGDAPETIALRFRGGRAGDRVEEVAGSPIPGPGERGIYFVERLDRFYVNPLYGWHQGRLRILRAADGHDRVLTSRGRPVVGVDGATAMRRRAVELPREDLAVPDAAIGIRVDADAGPVNALRLDVLEAALATRLGALR